MSKKNYTKFSKPATKIVDANVVEVTEMNTQEMVEEYLVGVVTNCIKLNIREYPKTNATIVCDVDCLTEVEIDEKASTSDFYKVYLPSGVEGFCMKKYIALRP